jgi:RNA polymerase sigma-70 factor (ECF subfamily)
VFDFLETDRTNVALPAAGASDGTAEAYAQTWRPAVGAERLCAGAAPSLSRQAAFEIEALPHVRALYRAACRLTRSPQDAEDLVQETCLRAYRAFDQYTPGTNIRGWLFTILYSAHADSRRRASRRPATVTLLAEPASRASETSFASQDLERALLSLPNGYCSVVLLRDIEGFSYQDIARRLRIPIGTVMSRLHRGRALLRSALVSGSITLSGKPSAPGRLRSARASVPGNSFSQRLRTFLS